MRRCRCCFGVVAQVGGIYVEDTCLLPLKWVCACVLACPVSLWPSRPRTNILFCLRLLREHMLLDVSPPFMNQTTASSVDGGPYPYCRDAAFSSLLPSLSCCVGEAWRRFAPICSDTEESVVHCAAQQVAQQNVPVKQSRRRCLATSHVTSAVVEGSPPLCSLHSLHIYVEAVSERRQSFMGCCAGSVVLVCTSIVEESLG